MQFILADLFTRIKGTKLLLIILVTWSWYGCAGDGAVPGCLLIIDSRFQNTWKQKYISFMSKTSNMLQIHTFQTGGFPGGPCKTRVRNVCNIFAWGKALDCETLPNVEEISRNATILSVHAIYGANDKRRTVVMGRACGRSMCVGGAGFQLLWKYSTAATTSVGGAGYQIASTMDNIACKF